MLTFNALLFVLSLFLLYRGASYVVDYASRSASQFGITPLVIALTIVAIGTSAPELVASIAAALENKPDLLMGTNVGSNIANIGLIMGVGALLRTIKVQSKTLKREIPFFLGAAVLLFLFSLDNLISRTEGLILILLSIVFFIFLLYHARKERVFDEAVAEVKAKLKPRHPSLNIFMMLFGIAILIVGARFLISSATFLAVTLGVTQAVIGITLIALGTSLPELVTAIVATYKHNNEIVVGNVIGSNILNIFLIIGVTAVLVPIAVSNTILRYDMPLMLIFSFLIVALMRTKFKVTRPEGIVLVTSYIAYIIYVVVRP